MQNNLKESIRRDAEKGINKKESENEFILREASKIGIFAATAAATLLFILQAITLGFPNFGAYFVLLTMLLTTSIYKAKKQNTFKDQRGIIIIELLLWLISFVGAMTNYFFSFPY